MAGGFDGMEVTRALIRRSEPYTAQASLMEVK